MLLNFDLPIHWLLDLLIYPFIVSAIHWFINSLIRPFIDYSIHWFLHSFLNWSIYPLQSRSICVLFPENKPFRAIARKGLFQFGKQPQIYILPIDSSIYWFLTSLILQFISFSIHSSIHSFFGSLISSFIDFAINWFRNSLIYPLTDFAINWFRNS